MKTLISRKAIVFATLATVLAAIAVTVTVLGISSAFATVTPTQSPDTTGYISPTFSGLNVTGGTTTLGATNITGNTTIGGTLGTNSSGPTLTGGALFDTGSNRKGIVMSGQDKPMLTNGFDTFTSGIYQGIGRWGIFMEPSKLTFGIPALSGRYFVFKRFNADSSGDNLMLLDVNGNLTTAAGVTANGDVASTGNITAKNIGVYKQAFSDTTLAVGAAQTHLGAQVSCPSGIAISCGFVECKGSPGTSCFLVPANETVAVTVRGIYVNSAYKNKCDILFDKAATTVPRFLELSAMCFDPSSSN